MFTTCLLAELASYRKELATSNNEDFLQKKFTLVPGNSSTTRIKRSSPEGGAHAHETIP